MRILSKNLVSSGRTEGEMDKNVSQIERVMPEDKKKSLRVLWVDWSDSSIFSM